MNEPIIHQRLFFVVNLSEGTVVWDAWTIKRDAQAAALKLAGPGFKSFTEAKRKGWVDVIEYKAVPHA